MVASVSAGNDSTRNIIRNAIEGGSENTVLPSRITLCRRIQCARRRLHPMPALPVQRTGFEMSENYTKTASASISAVWQWSKQC